MDIDRILAKFVFLLSFFYRSFLATDFVGKNSEEYLEDLNCIRLCMYCYFKLVQLIQMR